VGNAAAATAEDGRAVVQAASAQLAQLLSEISDLPASTLCDTPSCKLRPRRLPRRLPPPFRVRSRATPAT
jgi:hypothetical protein